MRKLIAALTVAASFAAVAPAAQAADDVFLRVDGITGEHTVGKDSGYIGVEEFSWGTENLATVGSASGGAGAGKAQFQGLTIKKRVDATSPMFFKQLAAGAHFKSLELVVRKNGSAAAPHLRYMFQTVFTSKIDVSGGTGEEGTAETITFQFGAASQEFRGQGANGAQLQPVWAGWNQMTNKAAGVFPAFGTPAI
jgi:type VI secretion system secreted protein Hcp